MPRLLVQDPPLKLISVANFLIHANISVIKAHGRLTGKETNTEVKLFFIWFSHKPYANFCFKKDQIFAQVSIS